MPQRQAPPTSVPAFSNRPSGGSRPAAASPSRPAASRPTPPTPGTSDRVPASLRKDNITGASAEDIAQMVGSKQPVIPPAPDEPEDVPPPPGDAQAPRPADAPAPVDGSIDLATFVDAQLRPAARKRMVKLDALLNGSCHAVSWEGGVLTLGFYQDAHHKREAEQAGNKKQYEAVASELLGAPVTLRCIIVERPTKTASKSALVQHAVQNHGATIVSDE
jgi:hypothetical protein